MKKSAYEYESEFEQIVHKAVRDLTRGLRANGHMVDDDDKALLLNELRRHFFTPSAMLINALNNIDFHLDEFASGFCQRPRRAGPQGVVQAVEEAMGTLRVELATRSVRAQHLSTQREVLREALTELKVAHLNKKVKLPIPLHAMIESTLRDTADEKAAVRKGKRR